MHFSLYALVLFLVVSVNHLLKARHKREVLLLQLCFHLGSRLQADIPQKLNALANQHGCLSPPLLENQRPFGIDRLEQIFRANTESRLMELFLFHFRQTGYTLKQIFLLTPAYGTVDPENLKAILSSNFSGIEYTAIDFSMTMNN